MIDIKKSFVEWLKNEKTSTYGQNTIKVLKDMTTQGKRFFFSQLNNKNERTGENEFQLFTMEEFISNVQANREPRFGYSIKESAEVTQIIQALC